jgi:hypothetical protein
VRSGVSRVPEWRASTFHPRGHQQQQQYHPPPLPLPPFEIVWLGWLPLPHASACLKDFAPSGREA